MPNAARSSEIARAIRRVVSGVSEAASTVRPASRSVVAGGIALLALAPGAATAVGLGDAEPRSTLGEPLRASVPLRLATGETIRDGCVTAPAPGGRDLRQPGGTRVRAPNATGPGLLELQVSTPGPLYEPLYELTLQVDCPGLPKVIRHYVLMLDLPGLGVGTGMPGQAPLATRAEPVNRGTVLDTPAPRQTTSRPGRLAPSRAPIPAGSRYRVREGDTLSTIAARVKGRPRNGTWQLADVIFAANPRAFIRDNPNLIQLGAEIQIPGADAWSVADPTPLDRPVPAEAAAEAAPLARAPLTEAPEPISARPPIRAAAETAVMPPISAPATAAVPATVATQPPPAPTTAPASPFADEPVAPETQPDTLNDPPPLTFTPRQNNQVSPLLAVLFGMLLGFGTSILLLRSRLLDGLSSLFARGRTEPAAAQEQPTYADTDEWLNTDESLHSGAVELGTPDEPSYIVEVEEQAAGSGATVATEANVDLALSVPGLETTPEPELAELFDDELADLPAEPDLPVEIFADAEVDIDVGTTAPAEEVPRFDESDALCDPTLEQPVSQDADCMGETVEQPANELDGLASETSETAELGLQGLADVQAEPTQRSATLQDALSVLDADFGEDLTASQIIDQNALNESLEGQDGERERRPRPSRKRAS